MVGGVALTVHGSMHAGHRSAGRVPRGRTAAFFSLSQANPREPPGQVKQNPLVVEQITPFTFGKLVMFLSATGSKINFSCMPCNTGLPRACLVCKKQI
jgi:hypothetical protein